MEELAQQLGVSEVNPGILSLFVGGALLLFGRSLYFLLLGVAGFVVGWQLPSLLNLSLEPNVQLVVGILAGIVCAFLARAVHGTALILAGALLGVVIGGWLVQTIGTGLGAVGILIMALSALVLAFVLPRMFDLALVGASSFVGASLIVGATPLETPASWLALAVLVLVGVSFQRRGPKRERRARRREREARAT